MTTCYFVSDLHGSIKRYEILIDTILKNKPSFVFMGGDLLPHVRVSDKQKNKTINPFISEFIIPQFKKLQRQLGCNYPEVYLIPGNDDYKIDIPGFAIGHEKDLWKLIVSNKVRFGPYTIYGYSYVPPTPFRIKDWEKYDIDYTVNEGCIDPKDGYKSEEVVSGDTQLISEDISMLVGEDNMNKAIFLFHSPPFGCSLDKIPSGLSIGSKAITEFITQKQPYITMHGHAHETVAVTGQWRQLFGRTHSFSAANDQSGLALIEFQIDQPSNARRLLLD